VAVNFAIAQMQVSLGQPEQNLGRARQSVREAKDRGADFVVLPELWSTGYVLEQAAEYGCALQTGIFESMGALASEFKIFLCGSVIEANAGRFFNTQVIYSPDGSLLASYRKLHLFGLMREPEFLSPGDKPITVRLPWGKAGLAICYDLRFPELFRSYALSGAHLFLISAEWPTPRLDHWRTLLRARAIENQCFVVACNCVGEGNGNVFGGHSMIIDPWGKILAEGADQDEVISATLDLDLVDEIRSRYPVLRDERPDIYQLARL
jgi:predicted amidohydrolase